MMIWHYFSLNLLPITFITEYQQNESAWICSLIPGFRTVQNSSGRGNVFRCVELRKHCDLIKLNVIIGEVYQMYNILKQIRSTILKQIRCRTLTQIRCTMLKQISFVQNIETTQTYHIGTNQMHDIDTYQMKIFETNRTYKILKQIKPKIWKRLSSCWRYRPQGDT